MIVSKIPNFDPTQLPYWDIYEREGTAQTIPVGGTMAGQFTAGLSGGQRKLMLFELIYQRTKNQSQLLVVLDEPFAGVTDDFVPFIVDRLNRMRQSHNILLVTNDHVETLKNMADNVITVSAIDRSTVKINDREKVDREKAIIALSLGDEYQYANSNSDLKFFVDVEILHNGAIIGVAGFSVFAFLMFLATTWDSKRQSSALVLIAGGIIAYFSVNPYLLSLVDWRNFMSEEAEALLHASKGMNKLLKMSLTISMVFVVSLLEYGFVNAVIDGLGSVDFWVAMLFDSLSLTFGMIFLSLYSTLPHQAVQVFGSMPFLFMIFFSTTFSPGSGVPGLKELRYLFARFYFWCMVPYVENDMEGCPSNSGVNLLLLVLSGSIAVFLFIIHLTVQAVLKKTKAASASAKKEQMYDDAEFQALQLEMYGAKNLRKLQHTDSTGDMSISTHSAGKVISQEVTSPESVSSRNPMEFDV